MGKTLQKAHSGWFSVLVCMTITNIQRKEQNCFEVIMRELFLVKEKQSKLEINGKENFYLKTHLRHKHALGMIFY